MAQSNNILEELRELESSLVQIQVQDIFQVPAGYFDNLATNMLHLVKTLDSTDSREEIKILSPLLAGVSREMLFSIPADYFDRNIQPGLDVINKDQTPHEEIEGLSPMLAGLKKEMPYSVPAGYFDNIKSPEISKPAKVVSISSRKWFRYAAAAVVAGVILTFGLIKVSSNTNSERSIARFEKKLNKEIKKTSDQELNDFIKYTDAGQDLVYNQPKEEIKAMLKDVPATELQEFLEEIADPEINTEENSNME